MIDLGNLIKRQVEATVHYMPNEYTITSPGTIVKCCVTGKPIPVHDIKYWSVARQEPYLDAAASLKRHLELLPKKENQC